MKMQKQQNIRLNGAEFDAIMYGISKEQKEILEEDPKIENYGIVMVTGGVKETEADKTPGVGLAYADEIYWDEMMPPARKFVKGRYPTKENEIMVTAMEIQIFSICRKSFVISWNWMRFIMAGVLFLFIQNGCLPKHRRSLLTV